MSATARKVSYVTAFRFAMATTLPAKLKSDAIRTSGQITGHVVYVRSEGRFQIDLTDETTLESRTVFVPAVFERGHKITAMERTVAFREAIRTARWRTRAARSGKRVLVRRVRTPGRIEVVASE